MISLSGLYTSVKFNFFFFLQQEYLNFFDFFYLKILLDFSFKQQKNIFVACNNSIAQVHKNKVYSPIYPKSPYAYSYKKSMLIVLQISTFFVNS